jgi:hypothetical protein
VSCSPRPQWSLMKASYTRENISQYLRLPVLKDDIAGASFASGSW